ncbi:hypothetical protein NE237_008616 [Protea cynaroides]|uniref:Aldehyde dehydrogenase domain-containing protein n=1 Tax=Protea cynaroides TaxID=273540 RepID=A0A9Q0KWU6_9MAGN|nr:hypothetical protein NE237_008616 [Protea cynaroides]
MELGVLFQIMRKAAETLIPVTLELGGKDAFIVCEDVDVPHVAQIAVRAALQSSGQNYAGVKRFYVHRDVYSSFVAQVVKTVKFVCAHVLSKESEFWTDMADSEEDIEDEDVCNDENEAYFEVDFEEDCPMMGTFVGGRRSTSSPPSTNLVVNTLGHGSESGEKGTTRPRNAVEDSFKEVENIDQMLQETEEAIKDGRPKRGMTVKNPTVKTVGLHILQTRCRRAFEEISNQSLRIWALDRSSTPSRSPPDAALGGSTPTANGDPTTLAAMHPKQQWEPKIAIKIASGKNGLL